MQFFLSLKQLLHVVSFFEETPGTIFLFSAEEGISYLALFPTTRLRVEGNRQIKQQGKKTFQSEKPDPWDGLQSFLSLSSKNEWPEWLGILNYEMSSMSDRNRKIPLSYPPEAYLQKSALLLKFDPKQNCAEIQFNEEELSYLSSEEKLQVEKFSNPEAWENLLNTKSPLFSVKGGPYYPLEEKKVYLDKIGKIQSEIVAGNVYQVNLSHLFLIENFKTPYSYFCKLMKINPAPFAAYLRLEDRVIISASPERLLSKKGKRLETNPIKGTSSRGKTVLEDRLLRETFKSSEKNRAELLMIVDLLRNDLGKISSPGSVDVQEVFGIKTTPYLYHTQASIVAEALSNIPPMELVRAAFPGGSISGCPKLSAQQLIYDLEKRARRAYTGSIGYFAANGDFDWNIAIRTLEVFNGTALVQLGGGIVYDSDPDQEYEETLLKGKALFEVVDA